MSEKRKASADLASADLRIENKLGRGVRTAQAILEKVSGGVDAVVAHLDQVFAV